MSVRALKKRDTQINQSSSNYSAARTNFFKKASTVTTSPKRSLRTVPAVRKLTPHLKNQYKLLGRLSHSNPEFSHSCAEFEQSIGNHLLRSKSEGDVRGLVITEGKSLVHLTAANAKSEICLQSISSHNYETGKQKPNKMLGGARSHRDLTQSAYSAQTNDLDNERARAPRRMSECSLSYSQESSGYSQQRMSSMSASQSTLSSGSVAPADPNAVLRVPIIGYEVMEERARFTVYKLRVENPTTNDCWLVMRRYTDFVRLNGKLKQAFPHISLLLPRKKLFGDNFNAVFLDNRVQGLQIFVNSVMAKEDLRKYKLVRDFFCLDEPPSYSESMEECRAIFEAQEETITHLKFQIQNKNDLILSLQQKLHQEIAEKEQLKEALKNANDSHYSLAHN